MEQFLSEWQAFGLRVALHNILWRYVHRDDAVVHTITKAEYNAQKRT